MTDPFGLLEGEELVDDISINLETCNILMDLSYVRLTSYIVLLIYILCYQIL